MGASVPRAVRRSRRSISVVMVGLLALAQIAGASVGVGAADPVTAQTAIARTEAKVGPTDAGKAITLSVSLAPNVNQQGMDAFLESLVNPKSPNYGKYLTPKEFTAKFLDAAGRTQVADFLKSKGLAVKDTGVGSIVNAMGTAAQVEAAFGVALNDYKDAAGKVFYANDKTPALPTALAPHITAVLGLSSQAKWKPHYVKATDAPNRASPAPRTATGCDGALAALSTHGYAPNQFATAYDFDALYTGGFHGEGQVLGLFELSDWLDSDSDTFKTCFGLTVTVNRVNVDGGTAIDLNGQVEVNLDIDVQASMAPKAAKIQVYVGPNSDAGVVDTYQQMATENIATVSSTSWGLCEAASGGTGAGTVVGAENTIFYQMATQGQQIFAASGDNGSEDCYSTSTILNVDDPAGQPYMTAVGGTTVNINQQSNAYVSETVWNHGGGSGGGGLSANWSRPAWQTGPGTTNTYTNGNREVPDLSAPADPSTGYVIFSAGLGAGSTYGVVGGTSGAAPFAAAAFAIMNQVFLARLGHRLGFTSPSLYQLLASSPGVYHDVTVGNNCAQGPGSTCAIAGNVYPATAGYDLATGVGTIKTTAFANALAPTVPVPAPAPVPRPGPITGIAQTPIPLPRPGGTPDVTTPAPFPGSR